MKNRLLYKLTIASLALMGASSVVAQDCTVNLSSVKQKIAGFGGINHPCWTGYDLTDNDIDKLFGVGDGKLGLSVMRIWVAESENNWSRELSTCKKVQKMGVKIFATPWNTPTSDMCTKTTAFCNNNSCQYRANEKQINTSAFSKYTDHLIKFNNYMYNNGVSLYAMSFANEPDYGHDWTWWSTDQVYEYTKNYAGKLRVNGTKVITAESFAYSKGLYDKVLNDANALKNIDILGTHFYASGASTGDNFFKYSLGDQKIAADPNKELWMTEYYTSSNATNGSPCRANVWPEALEVAYSIHRGMALSNMSAYVWWYLKRNYSLINNGDSNNENSKDGQITKRGWLFGQFARFIRPGYYRVDCTVNPTYNVYTSAYKNGDDVVIVAVNMSTEAKTINISVPGTKVKQWNVWITDQTRNMKQLDAINKSSSFSVTLPAKSCVTYVGEGSGKISLDIAAETLVIEEGDSVLITPTYKSESEIKNIKYFEGSEQVKDKWVAPFAFYYGADASLGKHTINAVAYDENGESGESAPITIEVVKKARPYGGVAAKIPGIIEAENFNEGASGISFYDAKEENNGDATYRSDSNVDVYVCDGGYAVGYCEAGEWLKYTVEVEKDGEYTLSANVSDEGGESSFSIMFDGDESTKVVFETEDTGAWTTYKELASDKVVKLSAGKHEMLLSIESSWVNVDWIKVKSTDPTSIDDVVAAFPSGEYTVCDANGKSLGNVTISSKTEFDAKFAESGVYILVSANGKSIKYVK
ncbi:MAG: carbohydrate-binding protein [Bacteroidales bacterium]|nr:carbohydrate-binding protein [Bacteroidales bacterium]